jgi:predicted polyphosphate/ATP-dependent NAD kinase
MAENNRGFNKQTHTMAENNPPNPVAGESGTGRVAQQQNVVINPTAQNAAAQLVQQILANTNVTLKQEVVKIPEFFSEKGKDTVNAQ